MNTLAEVKKTLLDAIVRSTACREALIDEIEKSRVEAWEECSHHDLIEQLADAERFGVRGWESFEYQELIDELLYLSEDEWNDANFGHEWLDGAVIRVLNIEVKP